jgi:hypothetical protein
MLRSSFAVVMVVVALPGCSGGGGVGEPCGGNDDCSSALQCLNSYCVQRCERAPDCGDGYACDDQGGCQLATGEAGDPCEGEADCAAGLSCQIDAAKVDQLKNRLVATCSSQVSARPAGSACEEDQDCRNGTCALGHCIDLCRTTRDCGAGTSCRTVPRVVANGALFAGCMPAKGAVTWSIPVSSPSAEILLPVPPIARSATLVMSVDDPGQKVGATSVLSPSGARLYSLPCNLAQSDPPCLPSEASDQFYANRLRHEPAAGQSVLQVPSGSSVPLEGGVYRVEVSSLRANGSPGTSIPQVTAVIQLGDGEILDLHFFFLDLADHPCVSMGNGGKLDATTAQSAAAFQNVYLRQLRVVFARAALMLSTPTYDDITDRPELDGINVADAGKLLSLGHYGTGINVFFVRSLSPIGLQAYGPNPGPAGLGGTPQSGIVIALDSLCYRDWTELARLTAHEIGRYMGLYHNVELETGQHPTWRDPISDSDDSGNNLMFFSEIGGTELSAGQRSLLSRSGVLR